MSLPSRPYHISPFRSELFPVILFWNWYTCVLSYKSWVCCMCHAPFHRQRLVRTIKESKLLPNHVIAFDKIENGFLPSLTDRTLAQRLWDWGRGVQRIPVATKTETLRWSAKRTIRWMFYKTSFVEKNVSSFHHNRPHLIMLHMDRFWNRRH